MCITAVLGLPVVSQVGRPAVFALGPPVVVIIGTVSSCICVEVVAFTSLLLPVLSTSDPCQFFPQLAVGASGLGRITRHAADPISGSNIVGTSDIPFQAFWSRAFWCITGPYVESHMTCSQLVVCAEIRPHMLAPVCTCTYPCACQFNSTSLRPG